MCGGKIRCLAKWGAIGRYLVLDRATKSEGQLILHYGTQVRDFQTLKMKLRLLDLLVCPIDKSTLELISWQSSPVTLSKREITRAERLGLQPTQFSTDITTGI